MPVYPVLLPLFAVAAVAGAMIGRAAWRFAGLPGYRGALIVGGAGAAGPLLTMVPLRACTFEPGRTALDYAVGVVAFAAGAGVAIAAAVWLGRALAVPGGVSRLDQGDRSGTFRTAAWLPLGLLLPTLAILALFLYWPLLETLRMSTHTVRLGAPRQPFACVDNYTRLLGPTLEWWLLLPALLLGVALLLGFVTRGGAEWPGSGALPRVRGWLTIATVLAAATALFGPAYRSVFVTTMILTSGTVVIGLAVGLAIAVLLSQPVRGRGIYRTLLIWPYAISPPIAGILFFVIFDPLSGIAGQVVETLTPWQLPNYRTDPSLARAVVILASVWKTLGFTILFYIAGLQNVSSEMLEAAHLDGANAWQRFRWFVVPALSPITFFLVVTNVTYAFFEVFGTINYLTRGGPSGATTDAMTSIVQVAQVQGSFGDGAARSMVLFAMVLAVTAWQFRSTGRRVSYSN
ncbi:sugar ABC transporter permease [Natronosporangium hydrolyticum]|uniref:sn-glycerol-3-phosphate transport system permease protein UgpA n=1 Tax=Natronosporangium hydrolyticum TaxID=2811111 RepID=A0A895YHY5_9ACTN|nr:sugar ABC transporter permease [Natronosporangium hydrolyticum]QSB15672.1 sugar ABC transporter permease [Natronosporangium hydrolyticum]